MTDGQTATSSGKCPATTTLWTQVISVVQAGDSDAAHTALGQFCEQYRPAIYTFFRNHGRCDHEQAEEYAHDFLQSRIFERLADRNSLLHKVERRADARFRTFLAHALWTFLRDQWRRRQSQKAGGGAVHIPIEGMELSAEESDEKVLQRFGSKLDRELAVRIIEMSAGRFKHADCLIAHFRGELSQREAARRLGLSENAFKAAYCRFRERLAKSVWEEVAKIAGPDPDEIRAEIRYLMGLFAGSDE